MGKSAPRHRRRPLAGHLSSRPPLVPAPLAGAPVNSHAQFSGVLIQWVRQSFGAHHVGPTVRRSAAGSGHWLHAFCRALRIESMRTTGSAVEPRHPTGCGSASGSGGGGVGAAARQAVWAELQQESANALQSAL
jgi:hypothetical protein